MRPDPPGSAEGPTFGFEARLWRYPGKATWYFVRLPIEIGEELRDLSPPRRGFGSVKVRVQAGGHTWETSVFPDATSGSYVLPVKRAIRDALGIDDDDPMQLSVTPLLHR